MTATPTAPINAATHIREAAERLLAARARAASAALVCEEHQARVRREYAADFELAATAMNAEKVAETQLRELALAHHATTGERKPCPGVEVQMRASFTFDPDAVMAWAKRTGVGLVPERYDEKLIQKVAKSAPGTVDGVAEVQEPFVKVASDLAAALYPEAQ